MPDSKITALTSISTSTDPANDPLVIVDVSDTSMAATGTTKKVTLNQLLGSGGTATLASATITGDLTVDTNTLKVDSANNRVGVGTATPSSDLHIRRAGGGSTLEMLRLDNAGAGVNSAVQMTFWAAGTNYGNITGGFGGATPILEYNVGTTGYHGWQIAGSEQMRLNSTGLGVGIVPSSFGRFSVQGTAVSAGILGMNTDATRCDIQSYNVPLALNRAGNNITMCEGGGNVGIGVTPAGTGGCLQLKSGITFPATQVASSDANTLDDYVERTWTGTLKGSISDPTVPVTATGRITKIGRKVMAEITFSNVSTVGASGAITITGLPYTNNGSVNGVGIASLNLIGTFTGSPLAFINIGASTIELYADVSSGASTQITHNAGVARYMTIQITFTV